MKDPGKQEAPEKDALLSALRVDREVGCTAVGNLFPCRCELRDYATLVHNLLQREKTSPRTAP